MAETLEHSGARESVGSGHQAFGWRQSTLRAASLRLAQPARSILRPMSDHTADRLAIGELLARYSWAMTDNNWDAWEATFTQSATADYSAAGGPSGSAHEARVWLEQTFAMFEVAVSQGTNLVIDFAGEDEADARSGYRMTMKIGGETPIYMEAQGWYRDHFVRTAGGWRIASRTESVGYIR
jgi:SnoaL-like domain